MTRASVIIAILLAAGSQPLVEDPPVARPPRAGAVTGCITPPEQIAGLAAVSRVTGKMYRPADFDAATGRFIFGDLPGDARYDIIIETTDGRRIEGIDLDFVDARLLRLAELRREALGLPAPPARTFTRADADAILHVVADSQDFADTRRVLYVSGDGPRATALVELIRAREFHASGRGELIWRVELWYFQYAAGGWQKVANQERVLRRERLSADRWATVDVTYYPALSFYIAPDGSSDPVEFTIPPAVDPSRGRPAGSEVELRTAPHVLGIEGQSTSAPCDGDSAGAKEAEDD